MESLFPGDTADRFQHALLRDAAYRRLLKRDRADLHERLGAWFERVAGPRMLEFEGIVGYHLEQAYRLRSELGPVDERIAEIGTRASARLASAGRRPRRPSVASRASRSSSFSLPPSRNLPGSRRSSITTSAVCDARMPGFFNFRPLLRPFPLNLSPIHTSRPTEPKRNSVSALFS